MTNLTRSQRFSVTFRYSPIYDEQCRIAFDLLPKQERPYPNAKTTMAFMRRLEKEWRKKEQETFGAIQKNSGVKWTVMEHVCYVVGSCDPFSDPLTLPIFAPQASIEYVSDVLCHEMIHRNLMEPKFTSTWKRSYAKLKRRFPKDNENVLVHVIVHALHEQIYLQLFSEERLKLDKRIMSAYPDYRRAWSIVEEVGSEKIIETYLK